MPNVCYKKGVWHQPEENVRKGGNRETCLQAHGEGIQKHDIAVYLDTL